jgi:flagellar protein FliO/FliZ
VRPDGLAIALLPASAWAADAAPPSIASGLLQTTLGLALVVGLVLGAAWLVRRLSPSLGGRSTLLRVVSSCPVGQRERVVVVEVGEQWLVVGVAAGSVTALATLPKGTAPDAAATAPSFATLLAGAITRKSG